MKRTAYALCLLLALLAVGCGASEDSTTEAGSTATGEEKSTSTSQEKKPERLSPRRARVVGSSPRTALLDSAVWRPS